MSSPESTSVTGLGAWSTGGRSLAPKRSIDAGAVGSTMRLRRVSATARRSESVPSDASRPPPRTKRAQADLGAARQPARVAGEQHAAVAAQRGSDVAGQRGVGRDVVALARAVQPRQQRRVAGGEPGGQAVAGVHAGELGAGAAVEQVRQAVAVVVDRVAPLPGHDGQHDEHPPGRALGLDREGHGDRVPRGAHGEEVDARVAAGAVTRNRALVLRPRLRTR